MRISGIFVEVAQKDFSVKQYRTIFERSRKWSDPSMRFSYDGKLVNCDRDAVALRGLMRGKQGVY